MVDIILNVKQIVVRLQGDRHRDVYLSAKGAGEVTASQLKVPAGVEIVNADLHIATLSANARFEMELTVGPGVGYRTADSNKVGLDAIGVIPIDSIFSPVRRVAYRVENTQVGQMTNFDRLVLDVETNGAIDPGEAVSSAGKTLRELHGPLCRHGRGAGSGAGRRPDRDAGSPDLELPIEALDLSERPRNCLRRAQIKTVGELIERTSDDLLNITNFGQKSLEEVIAKLDELGLSLADAGGGG